MKISSLFILFVVLISGQSCMTLVSKHSKTSVAVETNTPVKVYVYSHVKKKFIPAGQKNSVNGSNAVAEVELKKIATLKPTAVKKKDIKKLEKGDELVMHKKRYTPEMYAAKAQEVSGFDTLVKSAIKDELILKLVPDSSSGFKEVIYQVNAQKNKKRRTLAWIVNVPFTLFAVVTIPIDLNANLVQYDLPKKVKFTLTEKDENRPVKLPTKYDSADDPSRKDNSMFTFYSIKSNDQLQSLKKEAVEKGDYSAAADIKKEQDIRAAEQTKLNTLPQQIDEKVKAEDYTAADLLKKELEALKAKVEKKERLRKEIEDSLSKEDFATAEKLKADLKALY